MTITHNIIRDIIMEFCKISEFIAIGESVLLSFIFLFYLFRTIRDSRSSDVLVDIPAKLSSRTEQEESLEVLVIMGRHCIAYSWV